MTQPLSHNFIESLAEPRDSLYAAALARAGSAPAAEQLLLQSVRELFAKVAAGQVTDVPGSLGQALGAAPEGVPAPMPADLWARLAAAVQLEAARSSHSGALNPDSVLLKPDPLLAPRKHAPRDERDEFDLSSPSRLVMLAGLAVLIGAVATIYIITRPGSGTSSSGAAGGAGAGAGARTGTTTMTSPAATRP